MQLTSESDYLANSIPSNELVITAHNDGSYDYTNPESYAKYLQERQAVHYTHKLKLENGEYESLDMGEYLLYNWKVSDRQVEFKARTKENPLEDTRYTQNAVDEGISAGAFMERIFTSCGISQYVIPDFLYNSPPITPYVGDCSHKEAMCQVASLCGCVIYRTVQGFMIVHKIEFVGRSVDTLDYANQFSAPDSTSNKYYNAIQLVIYPADESEVVYETHTAPWYQQGETIYPYKLDLKMCIADERWEALKPWVLEQKFRVLSLRLRVESNWRQNPAQEVGDYAQIQLDKSGRTVEAFMQKQVLTYRGGVLKGNSVGISSGNI